MTLKRLKRCLLLCGVKVAVTRQRAAQAIQDANAGTTGLSKATGMHTTNGGRTWA